MNYLFQPLSAKLEELGLKSESGRWHSRWEQNHPIDSLADYPKWWDVVWEKDGVARVRRTGFENLEDKEYLESMKSYDAKFTLAYSLSDILNPDNLKKLFGEEDVFVEDSEGNQLFDAVYPECACEYELPNWQYQGQKLLEAYWQGWDQLEKYLEGVL